MRSETLILILGMAVVTYLTRVSFLFLFRNLTLPSSASKGVRFIPIGILTAIIVPGLLITDGQINFSLNNPYLLAGFVSTLAVLKWKSMFASLAAGMAAIILLKLLPLIA